MDAVSTKSFRDATIAVLLVLIAIITIRFVMTNMDDSNQGIKDMSSGEPMYIDLEYMDEITWDAILVMTSQYCEFCKEYYEKTLTPYVKNSGKYPIYMLELTEEENGEWADSLGVESVPSTLFIKDGEIKGAVPGNIPPGDFNNVIQALMK